jgi:dienelactone hydrolase
MYSLFARLLDRWTIRTAAKMMRRLPQPPYCDTGIEAARLLAHPDLLASITTPPGDFTFADRESFSFSSSVRTPWAENNRVHGRFFPVGEDWRTRPVVLLLHGWNAEACYRLTFPTLAVEFNQLGVNVGMIELPYHSQRRPASAEAVKNFISDNLARMVEATSQAVADAQAFLNWASAQGCPQGGVWGFSLGAWLAGLLATVRPSLGCAVLTTPVCRLDETIQQLEFCDPIRRALIRTPLELSVLSLVHRQPKMAVERILIVEGRHDEFIHGSSVEALCESWKRSERWRVPHGHISILMSRRTMRDTVRWIADRLHERQFFPSQM